MIFSSEVWFSSSSVSVLRTLPGKVFIVNVYVKINFIWNVFHIKRRYILPNASMSKKWCTFTDSAQDYEEIRSLLLLQFSSSSFTNLKMVDFKVKRRVLTSKFNISNLRHLHWKCNILTNTEFCSYYLIFSKLHYQKINKNQLLGRICTDIESRNGKRLLLKSFYITDNWLFSYTVLSYGKLIFRSDYYQKLQNKLQETLVCY